MTSYYPLQPLKSMETVSYSLYMHRLELRRPKRSRRVMRVATTKLQLTNGLIYQQLRQWQEPDYQTRNTLNRERQYRDALWRNMQQHLERLQQGKLRLLEAKRNKS